MSPAPTSTRLPIQRRNRPRRPHRRTLRRVVVTAGLGVFVAVLPLAAAQAHVTVHPDTTTAGAESAEITFRVPTESATAGTAVVQLSLPTAHPLAEVLARPIPGWSVTVHDGPLPAPVVVDGTTFTEAPLTVTWTAGSADAQVKPGQYQDFSISAGPLPQSGAVTFTARQTYSDGSVVNWNQPQAPGQDEPEHPAPSFLITPVAAHAAAGGTTTGSGGTNRARTASGSDTTARTLGGAAVVLSLVAVGLAWLGLRGAAARQRAGQ
jgi:uncharacterized protein YcnI